MNSSDLFQMGGVSTIDGATVYLCVARWNRTLHSYSNADDDGRRAELDSLAARCLETAPPFHSWCSHTAGATTAGFLTADDGRAFLSITVPGIGGAATRKLLEGVRRGFDESTRNGVRDDLVPVVQSLIASLESISRRAEEAAPVEASTSAPLLGKAADEVKIEVGPVPVVGQLLRSLSSAPGAKAGRCQQQSGRWLTSRHVKIIVAADALLCLVLFGVWMVVCRGLRCVSGR